MTKKDIVYAQLIVDRLAPDRSQFKPYGISFIPHKTLVEVPVTAKEVRIVYQKDADGNDLETPDFVVLTLDGLMEITGHIADKLDNLHNQHLEDKRNGVK